MTSMTPLSANFTDHLSHRYKRTFVLTATEEIGTNRVEFKIDFTPEANESEQSPRMAIADVVMGALMDAGFLQKNDEPEKLIQ